MDTAVTGPVANLVWSSETNPSASECLGHVLSRALGSGPYSWCFGSPLPGKYRLKRDPSRSCKHSWIKKMAGAAVQSPALASSCRATAKLLRTLSSHGRPISHTPVKQIFLLTAACPPHEVSPISLLHGAPHRENTMVDPVASFAYERPACVNALVSPPALAFRGTRRSRVL